MQIGAFGWLSLWGDNRSFCHSTNASGHFLFQFSFAPGDMVLCNGTVVIRDQGVDNPSVGISSQPDQVRSSLSPDFATFPDPLSLSKRFTATTLPTSGNVDLVACVEDQLEPNAGHRFFVVTLTTYGGKS